MGRADVYSQPGAPDPVLPAPVVLELARAHLPVDLLAHAQVEVDESGGEARAYLIGGPSPDERGSCWEVSGCGVVVKTQRPHRLRPRTSLAKEAALLTALATPLSGRIPTVYGYDRISTEFGPVEFIVMSRIPGRPVRASALTDAARRAVLDEVADVLREVHALDLAGLQPRGLLPADGGAADLRTRLEPGLADLVEQLQSREECWPLPASPARVAELALDALPHELTDAPAALHSNPGPTHVFTDSNGTFTGLIDFGDAYASHPALDLRSWPDAEDRITLCGSYLGGSDASAEWNAVWTVAMVYADLAALTGPDRLAERAAADLSLRLGQL
jgi:hygromycin-B 7''-O-kinase